MPGFGTTSEIRPSRRRSRTISPSATRARSRVHHRPITAISASAATASPRASNQLPSGNTARTSAGPGPALASVDDSLHITTPSFFRRVPRGRRANVFSGLSEPDQGLAGAGTQLVAQVDDAVEIEQE